MKTKRVKVVMLPTEKAEKGCVIDFTKYMEVCQSYSTRDYLSSIGGRAHHLYLIAEDEVERGDWHIAMNIKSMGDKAVALTDDECLEILESNDEYKESTVRIIATTNPELGRKIAEGTENEWFSQVPQIPQSFVEAYVEANGDIEEVAVELDILQAQGHGTVTTVSKYPKVKEDNIISIHRIEGAKEKEILDFAQWYSGIEREKVKSAYHRYLREEKNS